MIRYLIALAWGACVLVSFVGWGTVVNGVLLRRPRVDWGQRAAWGVAVSVWVGGLLNLAGLISRPAVLAWVIAGVITWLLTPAWKAAIRPRRWLALIARAREDRTVALGGSLVCFLAALQYGGWVGMQIQHDGAPFVFPQETAAVVFNVHDDFHAYFVFPKKMLATGSLGQEPFSERRLNALGGQSFLHTLVLAALSEEYLHLLEPAVATLIVIGLMLGYFAECGTPVSGRILVLLIVLLVPPPYMNISALIVATALFLSLFRTLARDAFEGAGRMSRAVVIALTTAAICALKSSLIPAGIALFSLGYTSLLITSRFERRMILEASTAVMLVAVFLLPWMVSMRDAFGTPLYPVLGTGPLLNPESARGILYPSGTPIREILEVLGGEMTSASIVSVAVLTIALSGASLSGGSHRRWVLIFLSSALLGTLAVTFLLIGMQTYRFHFSFVFAALLVAMTHLLTTSASGIPSGVYLRQIVAAAVGAGLFIGWAWEETKFYYVGLARNVHTALVNSGIPSNERESYRRMQLAIPEGQAVLTILEKPFLLDFTRNPIFIVDNPGELPPSIPPLKAAEQLAGYLLGRSIRFTAYAYRNESGIPKAVFRGAYYQRIAEFHRLLDDLGRTRKRLYDDGYIFVIDLSEKQT